MYMNYLGCESLRTKRSVYGCNGPVAARSTEPLKDYINRIGSANKIGPANKLIVDKILACKSIHDPEPTEEEIQAALAEWNRED